MQVFVVVETFGNLHAFPEKLGQLVLYDNSVIIKSRNCNALSRYHQKKKNENIILNNRYVDFSSDF